MRIVHVSFFVDPRRREPAHLLEAWPTLARLGPSIASTSVSIAIIQPAAAEALIDRNGAVFHFVAGRRPTLLARRLGHWASPRTLAVVERAAALDPDVVHFHSLSFPLHLRRLRKALPRARIIVQDHADHPMTGWRRGLVRATLEGADAAAFTSPVQAEPFVAAGILDPRLPIHAVPESSSTFLPGDMGRARAETGLGGDPCVVWLGHLDRNKDPMTALSAIREAARDLPGIRLFMAWLAAPLLETVQRQIATDPELQARVTLLGPQPYSHIEKLLQAADMLIQCSHSEGSGYAVIEAMACGTVPIVTQIPSFRELTGNGQAGGLSPVGDAGAMAESIVRWAAMPAVERRSRVRRHFEEHLSFDAIGARWRDIYALLLES
jgi:glycosyltransferase involved in cell wall biosynthesis